MMVCETCSIGSFRCEAYHCGNVLCHKNDSKHKAFWEAYMECSICKKYEKNQFPIQHLQLRDWFYAVSRWLERWQENRSAERLMKIWTFPVWLQMHNPSSEFPMEIAPYLLFGSESSRKEIEDAEVVYQFSISTAIVSEFVKEFFPKECFQSWQILYEYHNCRKCTDNNNNNNIRRSRYCLSCLPLLVPAKKKEYSPSSESNVRQLLVQNARSCRTKQEANHFIQQLKENYYLPDTVPCGNIFHGGCEDNSESNEKEDDDTDTDDNSQSSASKCFIRRCEKFCSKHYRDCIMCNKKMCVDCMYHADVYLMLTQSWTQSWTICPLEQSSGLPLPSSLSFRFYFPFVCRDCVEVVHQAAKIECPNGEPSYFYNGLGFRKDHSTCHEGQCKCVLKVIEFLQAQGFHDFYNRAKDETWARIRVFMKETVGLNLKSNPAQELLNLFYPLIKKKIEYVYLQKLINWEDSFSHYWRKGTLKRKWEDWKKKNICKNCLKYFSNTVTAATDTNNTEIDIDTDTNTTTAATTAATAVMTGI